MNNTTDQHKAIVPKIILATSPTILNSSILSMYHNKVGKSMKTASLIILCLAQSAWCATSVTTPVNFGGGVDHSRNCTDIRDNSACDSQNMVGDIFGSASKRDGSERYVGQAISTHSINSLYRASIDLGTSSVKVLLMTTWDRIYVSTSDGSPVWRVLKQGLKTADQHFSFANSRGKILMTGDALTDPVFQYDIIKDSFTGLFDHIGSTNQMNVRAKYVLAPNGYVVLGNILDVKNEMTTGTTYYGSMVAYSVFQQISSVTYARTINIKTDDGESITGMTEKGGVDGNQILVYKPSSISSVLYKILNLDELGGDITVSNVASGFGCISPLALVNVGDYDIVPTKDGLIFYNGGRKTRLNLIDEIRPVSTLIKTDYERTINYNTYDKSVGVYYPKKQWYLFSFNDPIYSPSDRVNRVFVYDIQTGEWWPLKNWLAGSFTTFEGDGDDGTLLYGDSSDGYVYKANVNTRNDDARKEVSLFTMDTAAGWTPVVGTTTDWTTFAEGTASVKVQANFSNGFISTMTNISLIPFGEYNDKSPVLRETDYLSFKLKMSSLALTKSITTDLQFDATVTSFTTIHSSVTLDTTTLTSLGMTQDASNMTGWTEIKIALSSFTLPADWNDPLIQAAPFSRGLTAYGIRFITQATSSNTTYVDDIRIVQGTDNIIEAYYLTKQFNLGVVSEKDFRQVILSRDKSADSSFSIDVFTDYGFYANRKTVSADIPKEIFVCGYKGSNGITRLKSTDFSVLSSTLVPNANVIDYMNGVASKDYLFMFDKVGNRLLALDRGDLSVIVSSYGSLGPGTTNFNTVNQMAISGDDIFLTDNFNDRMVRMTFKSKKLLFVKTYGELGLGSTNFFAPSGVTADQTHVWVTDDGNFKIKKFSISTFGFVSEQKIESNTIGESVLQSDGDSIYVAYNKVSNKPYYQDVVLERRTKGDMTLLNRTVVRPEGVVDVSTYTISGDIALLGKYLFIGFTKDLAQTGTYYVQKRLKDTFEIVDEYQTTGTQFSVIGDGTPYKPISQSQKINLEAKDGTYIQLKYYDNAEDNTFKLHNYSFAKDDKQYEETQ